MNKYLLSDEAIEGQVGDTWEYEHHKSQYKAIAKAQLRHTLERLEKEHKIEHDWIETTTPPFTAHLKTCWLCAALREVGA